MDFLQEQAGDPVLMGWKEACILLATGMGLGALLTLAIVTVVT